MRVFNARYNYVFELWLTNIVFRKWSLVVYLVQRTRIMIFLYP